MPDKIDFKKEFADLYKPSARDAKKAKLVEVPRLNFLMIDGHGDPNTAPEYSQAVEALYALSYNLKFAIKKSGGADYGVMPLEGLWWVEDMTTFSVDRKDDWDWTAMIMQPEFITQNQVDTATAEVQKKKNPPALSKIRFELFDEGRSAQILHIGPFADEGPTIKQLHQFIAIEGFMPSGKHHEIYLGDPRKTAPEKLKTIIRQPVA